ncbi:MAG: diguanylate cyclase [Rhodoferax sp.]
MTKTTKTGGHWVVRMNYRNRTASWVMVFGVMGTHFAGQSYGSMAWVLLALQFLVYPHLVYLRTRFAKDPLAAELNNMRLDALAFGAWIGALGFPLWLSFMLGISVCINLGAFRGAKGLLQATGLLVAGALLSLPVVGWHFQPDTSLLTSTLTIFGLSCYLLMFAFGAHQRTLALHAVRLKLRQSEQDLKKQIAEISFLQGQLTEQVNRDPLTGLFNRRYLNATMDREIARCLREREPLCAMMVDIDHFKRINDTYGHQAGDEVLVRVARILADELRAGDIACRYGGEEFLLLMPNLALPVAVARAHELRERLAVSSIQAAGQTLQVRLSIGVAALEMDATSAHELIRCADTALYQAKQEGRDRVVALSVAALSQA